MLDTINIKLSILNTIINSVITAEQGMEILHSQLKKIPNFDMNCIDPEKLSISGRLSYPRAFANTNAYLISTAEECQEVHHRFINDLLTFDNMYEEKVKILLKDWFLNYVKISITRIDIPFTYFIGSDEAFNSYQNIYRIVSTVFKLKNNKCIPKNIGTYLEEELETLILTDTANVGAYNKKVVIYDQNRKMQDYYTNRPEVYNSIIVKYPDLSSRMRIEVSQRLRIKEKGLMEFYKFDIYETYVRKFAQYALDNLFDSEILNQIYSLQINTLANLLQQEKNNPYFSYRVFICKYQNMIFDYKLLRQAIYLTIENINAKYSASSTTKKLIEGLEEESGIIYMSTIEKINDISCYLQRIVRGKKNDK